MCFKALGLGCFAALYNNRNWANSSFRIVGYVYCRVLILVSGLGSLHPLIEVVRLDHTRKIAAKQNFV